MPSIFYLPTNLEPKPKVIKKAVYFFFSFQFGNVTRAKRTYTTRIVKRRNSRDICANISFGGGRKKCNEHVGRKKKGAKCLTAPVIPVSPRFIYALFDPTNAEPSTCSVVYSRPCNSRLKIKRVSDIKT